MSSPHTRRAAAVGVGAAVAVAALVGGYAVGRSHVVSGTGSLASVPTSVLPRWTLPDPFGSGSGSGSSGSGSGSGSGSSGSGSGSGSSSAAPGTASAAQEVGIVDINTVLGYENGRAAGTGMVLTSSGEILTNNHVVDGATKITVRIVSSGATYSASVVGTDPTQDIAVIQLSGASGLQTAHFGSASSVKVGDAVTGVGNAGGAGGTPSAASGTVVALDQPITAADQNGGNAEHLTGTIETDAQIQAGDSGGPLYDSAGKVIGMDTAASTNGGATTAGYAITIDHALALASAIESATSSTSTIHLGLPAFLGVSVDVSATVSGAGVTGVFSGGPAARAGITGGDVITRLGGASITTGNALRTALTQYRPGQSVSVTWTDQAGASHTATVTLATGPAD